MLEVSEVGNCQLFASAVLERWVDVLRILAVDKPFAVVNLFSVTELCSNRCRTLTIGQESRTSDFSHYLDAVM